MSFQFLGGKFTLANDVTLESVEGRMYASAGIMNVHIREDASGLPENVVYSKTYTVTGQDTIGWKAFSGFNAALSAGSYWLTFEPAANGGITGAMPWVSRHL